MDRFVWNLAHYQKIPRGTADIAQRHSYVSLISFAGISNSDIAMNKVDEGYPVVYNNTMVVNVIFENKNFFNK